MTVLAPQCLWGPTAPKSFSRSLQDWLSRLDSWTTVLGTVRVVGAQYKMRALRLWATELASEYSRKTPLQGGRLEILPL